MFVGRGGLALTSDMVYCDLEARGSSEARGGVTFYLPAFIEGEYTVKGADLAETGIAAADL